MTQFIGFQSHHVRIFGKIYKSEIYIPIFNVVETGTKLDGSTLSLKTLIDLNHFKTIERKEKK